MANPNNDNKRKNDLLSWIIPVILLFIFPPVGIFLLAIKVIGLASGVGKRHPYDVLRDQQEAAARQSAPAAQTAGRKPAAGLTGNGRLDLIPDGKKFMVVGAVITAIFALATMVNLGDALYWIGESWSMVWQTFTSEVIPPMCGLAGGLAVLSYGLRQRKKGSRFHKYLSLIGRREKISLTAMSETAGIPKKTVYDDLQEMLDEGILPQGYLDLPSDQLVLSDEGIPEPEPEPEVTAQEPSDLSREDAILAEIRQVNDAIAQPELSAKIDRIEDITRKIFRMLKEDPGREQQLRSFLNYYLPTTLKILRAYASLESQGVEGENITAAKERIEGMMDKVVDGFEKQLDRLFEHDAMDITADVKVLEQMLDKDGLSGDQGMQIGV